MENKFEDFMQKLFPHLSLERFPVDEGGQYASQTVRYMFAAWLGGINTCLEDILELSESHKRDTKTCSDDCDFVTAWETAHDRFLDIRNFALGD